MKHPIFYLSLLGFFIVMLSFGESEAKNSTYDHCIKQGYKVGTLDFEHCYNRYGAEEIKEPLPQKRKILGRDIGGKWDKERVREEALDSKPRLLTSPDNFFPPQR